MTSIALVFPGQGSQKVGMGKDLHHLSQVAADIFSEADRVLGFSLSSICFEGPEEALTDTINAQPALLTASIAALRAWQAEATLSLPAFVAGHSMGEYSSLVAAGILDFADGLRLVRERGRLMKRAGEIEPGSMAAVLGLDRAKLDEACQQAGQETELTVQVANDNAPGQIVISGHKPAVERASKLAKEVGARRVVPLAVSIAAHSKLMCSIVGDFRQAVEATPMNPPRIPVVGNVNAQPLDGEAAMRKELVSQLTSPVRWVESVEWMVQKGVDTFVEVGPGNVLAGLIKRITREAQVVSVQDMTSIQKLIDNPKAL